MLYTAFLLISSLTIIWTIKSLIASLASPLARIPNAHFTAPVSQAWHLWIKYSQQESVTRLRAHRRLGLVVRMGPREVAVDGINGLRVISETNVDKIAPSANFTNYGLPFLLSLGDSKLHSERKRKYHHVYSRPTISKSPLYQQISEDILQDKWMSQLRDWSLSQTPIEVHRKTKAYGSDFVSSYVFGAGNGTRFLDDTSMQNSLLDRFDSVLDGLFWATEFPKVSILLHYLGFHLIPISTFDSQSDLEKLCLDLCEGAENDWKAENVKEIDSGIVYRQLRRAFEAGGMPEELAKKTIAAELLDHLIAGVHGIGITMSYLLYELSQNVSSQLILQKELAGWKNAQQSRGELDSVERLPFLNAVLTETLRLHPVSPGPTWRAFPARKTNSGTFDDIPPGTAVSACSYTLHRHQIFSDCEEWQPERWLGRSDEQLREMNRLFWAFGGGPRKCIGDHLAIRVLKDLTAATYAEFRTSIAKPSDMEQTDGMIGSIKGKELFLRFESLHE